MLKIFIVIVFVLSFSAFANAQAMTSYLFLEVNDSNQKPVPDARVETWLRNPQIISQNSENGKFRAEFLDMGRPKFWSQFTIAKNGYYSFYDFGERRGGSRRIKIELLKIPTNRKERKALGNQQLQRDFFAALQKQDLAAVRRLIKSGISPNLSTGDLRGISGYENIPAIIYPIFLGNGAMLKMLLKEGADVRRKDDLIFNTVEYYVANYPFRNFPPSEAERGGLLREYRQGLKALIKAGANLKGNSYGTTPLMTAVGTCDVEVIKILINGGVEVNAKNKSGWTALSSAKEYEKYPQNCPVYQEIIKLLRAAGAKD